MFLIVVLIVSKLRSHYYKLAWKLDSPFLPCFCLAYSSNWCLQHSFTEWGTIVIYMYSSVQTIETHFVSQYVSIVYIYVIYMYSSVQTIETHFVSQYVIVVYIYKRLLSYQKQETISCFYLKQQVHTIRVHHTLLVIRLQNVCDGGQTLKTIVHKLPVYC